MGVTAVLVIYANHACRDCSHPRKDHTRLPSRPSGLYDACADPSCDCDRFLDPRLTASQDPPSPRRTVH